MLRSTRTILASSALAGAAAATFIAFAQGTDLGIADYTGDGRLAFPADTDRWVVLGSSIGGNYSEEPFSVEDLRSIGVVQMEPAAYDYFLENGEYADGSMLLLTFYAADSKPDPALQGFVQGAVLQREIHVIDKRRFTEEGRAFFVFPAEPAAASPALPPGSECVVCHAEHGAFDATFTQFYPVLREHLAE